MYSSVPGSGSSGSAGGGGGEVSMDRLNGMGPVQPTGVLGSAGSMDTAQAHETSNGDHAERSISPAMAQPEWSQPAQGRAAASGAPAGLAAAAAARLEVQGDPCNEAVIGFNQVRSHETAAASVSHKGDSSVAGNVMAVQSGLAKGDASKDCDIEEASELIESQILTSNQSISQNLMED